MRKNYLLGGFITIMLWALPGFTASAQPSKELYMGIKSGMTKAQVFDQKKENLVLKYDLNKDGTKSYYYATSIYGRVYFVRPLFNKKNQLYGLNFICNDDFSPSEYEVNIPANCQELADALKKKYGEPRSVSWHEWHQVPKGGDVQFMTFYSQNNLSALIYVNEYKGDFYTTLVVGDAAFISEHDYETGF